jgi:hypothetical protein
MVNWDQFLTSIVFGILATAAGWMMRKAANRHAARRGGVITNGLRALGAFFMGLGLGLTAFAVSRSFW